MPVRLVGGRPRPLLTVPLSHGLQRLVLGLGASDYNAGSRSFLITQAQLWSSMHLGNWIMILLGGALKDHGPDPSVGTK